MSGAWVALRLKRLAYTGSRSPLVALEMLALEFSLDLLCRCPPARATHRAPVILVDSPTTHADLIILTVNTAMGPGELVTAKYFQESLKEFRCHTALCRSATTVARNLAEGVIPWSSWQWDDGQYTVSLLCDGEVISLA
jgi:hypothetical protein